MEIRLFPLRRSPTRRGLLAVLRNHQLLRHLCTLYPSLVFLVVMMMMANLPVIQRSAEPPYSPAQLLERSSSRTVRMWKPRLTVVKFPPLPTMPIYPSLHLRLKRALRRRFSALALSLPYLYTLLNFSQESHKHRATQILIIILLLPFLTCSGFSSTHRRKSESCRRTGRSEKTALRKRNVGRKRRRRRNPRSFTSS